MSYNNNSNKSGSRVQTRSVFADEGKTTVYLNQEHVTALIETLAAKMENPDGVVIDLYIDERTNKQNGNTFLSASFLIRDGKPKGSGGPSYNKQQPAPKFKPAVGAPANAKTAVDGLRAKLNKTIS